MNTVKIQHIFLSFCCKLPLILGILTQVFFFFVSLLINYYSKPALFLNCSLSYSLFSNLFFLLLLIFLLSLPFIVFFIYGFKGIFFLISVIVTIFFSINTSSADEIIIASDINQKVVPFSQLIEASLNQEFHKYNAIAKAHNVGALLGTNASSLNHKNPLLNSYSLLHQTFHASKINSSALIVSTDAFIKSEVAYLSRKILNAAAVLTLLDEVQSPIIYRKLDNIWVLTCKDLQDNVLITIEFKEKAQFVLNNYSHDFEIFPKSGTNLQTIRLGDSTVFSKVAFDVTASTEFKTINKTVDSLNVGSLFNEKFKKSYLMDQQLLDINAKKVYSKSFGDSSIKFFDLKKLNVNDYILTEKFKFGRRLATQPQNHAYLQFNATSNALNRFFSKFFFKH